MESMVIKYLNQEINISKEYCMALYLRDRYSRLAEANAKSYMQLYYYKYGDFLTFASNFCADGCKLLYSFFDRMAQELMALKTYDVDKERILQEHGDYIFEYLFYMHNEVNKLCESVDNEIESQRQLRELRKASRSRVVGGGFGISGALKGMALAGALNTASGIVHSGANAIGNAKTRLLINRKYQEAYNSKEMQSMVEECYKDCIIRCEKVLEKYLYIPDFPIEENLSRVRTLKSNLSKIPSNEYPIIIADIIKLNPFDFEIYKQILPIYGDSTGDLRKIFSYLPEGANQGWKCEYDYLIKSIFLKKLKKK